MPFKKGQSGNPGGRPKGSVDVVTLCRGYTKQAIETLIQVMQDPDATAASRVSAAEILLARGWGKPAQAITGPDNGPVQLNIRWLNQPPQP